MKATIFLILAGIAVMILVACENKQRALPDGVTVKRDSYQAVVDRYELSVLTKTNLDDVTIQKVCSILASTRLKSSNFIVFFYLSTDERNAYARCDLPLYKIERISKLVVN